MKSIGTLFTGFGGVEVGAMAAGLELAWGVEYRADVAEVANHNLGNHVMVADVLDCDPHDFASVDVLHASPPCTRASNANQGADVDEFGSKETNLDRDLARKVAEFVTVLQPQVFTLENVWAYRAFDSWLKIIEPALNDAGYWLNIAHVNAADYGVPQTRKRMIVRAVRGGFVPYLPPPVAWVGWYAAIADLIETLPDSQFAPWQLARLPEEITESLIVASNSNANSWGDNTRQNINPLFTITVNSTKSRALLVDGKLNDRSTTLTQREPTEPAFVTTTSHNQRDVKASLPSGRIVAMTPRALARFQSFPDWYELPAKRALAAYGIGNAVPPLLYQRIIEGLVTA